MIIEISGLPEGQKIKHINVDIAFEDDGTAVVTTKTEPKRKPGKVPEVVPEEIDDSCIDPALPTLDPFEEHLSVDTKDALGMGDSFDSTPIPPIVEEKREQKDIPPEMTDMEF